MSSGGRCAFRYSTEDLQRIRQKGCPGILRSLRRYLFILGISTCCTFAHENNPSKIQVRTSRRTSSLQSARRKRDTSVLIKIQRDSRPRRTRRNYLNRPPSIMVTNIRSVFNKMDELEARVREKAPDFVVLTESWLDNSIPDEAVALPRYAVIRKDRDRQGGGIILYVPADYPYKIITCAEVSSMLNCRTEFLAVLFPHVLLICLYHPFWNNSFEHDNAISCVTDIIDYTFTSVDSSRLSTILCGDFNGLRSYFDELSRLTCLSPKVCCPTRGENILDQIFTNINSNIDPTVHPPIGKSDHCVVSWHPSSTNEAHVTKVRVRKFSKANRARFDELVCSTDWDSLVKSKEEVECSANLFLSCLFSFFDNCFPFRTVCMRSTDPPWFKPSLRILIDDRNRAYAQGQMPKYKRLREEVISHTKTLKSRFMKSVSSVKSARETWKSIRVVGKFSRKASSSSTSFSAQQLSDYFASNFQTNNKVSVESVESDFPASSFQFSVFETYSYLKRMRRKSCGSDGIPFWVLRDWSIIFASPITALFNHSLRSGKVPSSFKRADIIPIPKVSRPNHLSDMRPISLLPLLSKILERMVLDKFILPLIHNQCDPFQFAYLPGRGLGTTTALTLMNHHILKFLDSQSGAVRVLTVDFSKAFDKITHTSILASCHRLSFPPTYINWIESFLSDRTQRVRVGNDFSGWTNCSSGVPQGSVLGPILFCLATGQLTALHSNTKVFKYADDITFLHFIRSNSDDKLQDEWHHCLEWSSRNRLPVNVSKCKTMEIITNKNICLSPIHTSNGTLPQVNNMKLLGLIFSSDMKWKAHVDSQLAKCSKRIYIIRNLRRAGCDPSLIFKVYVALIRSCLLYAIPSFCNLPKCLVSKLLSVEKRAKRIIADFSFPSDILSSIDSVCTRLFDNIHNHSDHPMRIMFDTRNSRTRNQCTLRPPTAKTKRFSSSFIKYCK